MTVTHVLLLPRVMWYGYFMPSRRNSSPVMITEKNNMFFSALLGDSQLPQQQAVKPYGR